MKSLTLKREEKGLYRAMGRMVVCLKERTESSQKSDEKDYVVRERLTIQDKEGKNDSASTRGGTN